MSPKGQPRVVHQERLPHREAVQRLLRVYAKLYAYGRPQPASGQTPTAVQEGEA